MRGIIERYYNRTPRWCLSLSPTPTSVIQNVLFASFHHMYPSVLQHCVHVYMWCEKKRTKYVIEQRTLERVTHMLILNT